MSVVRLRLPSWDVVNKQGQRWILAGITPAWTIHLHLLYTSYSSQHSAQHERQMFNDKFSIQRTEVQDCQQLLQLSWPFHSNCISPAMLGIPTTCLLHTDPVHMWKGSVLHQSRDKLHIRCLSKGSLIQETWVHNEHPCKYFLVKFLWLSKSQNTLVALQP